MSAVAIPPTKTAGYRPPNPPANRTGFGGYDELPDEPYHQVLTDSVKHLMKAIKEAEPESLPVLLKLIDLRKQMVEKELHYERMLAPEPLPPLISDLYSLEFLGTEEEPVSIYLRLLNTLDDAANRVQKRMAELNLDSPASEL